MHWAHPVPGFKMRNTSIMKPGHFGAGTPAWIILSHSQTGYRGHPPGLNKVCASVVEVESVGQIHEDKFGIGGDLGRLNGRKVYADYTCSGIGIGYIDDPSS